MNIAKYVERRVEQYPTKLAISFQNQRYTYEDFWSCVNRVGNGLKSLGILKGDRVGVMLSNCPEVLITHWGVIKIGGTYTPINIMFREKELKHVLNNSGAKVIVTSTIFLSLFENVWPECPQLENVVVVNDTIAGTVNFRELMDTSSSNLDIQECDPHQTADLYYTSGTTGRSKGVMKTHLSLSKLMEYQAELWKVSADDHSLVVLPLFHSYSMIIPSMMPLYAGGTQTLHERWDTKAVLETIVNQKITFFAGVPTMYTFMVRYPEFAKYDLTCLRLALVGGASTPVEIQREFEEKAKVRILEGYGCTGWVSSFNPLDGPTKHGSIGKCLRDIYPHMDTDMKIVGEDGQELPTGKAGELIVRGLQIPPGFWRMPNKTKEDYRGGWYYTGDICYKDDEDFFFLLDRKDDLIITSGYNVYPREIEEILYTYPKLNEAAVIGSADPTKGEIVTAYVSLKSGNECTEEEIIAFCKERISAYKVPRKVIFIKEMPKTANGKIFKKGLRDMEGKKERQ